MPLRLILDAQKRRRMNGDDQFRSVFHGERLAAYFADGDDAADQAAGRGDAERDDSRGLDQAAFRVEPDLAALDLVAVGTFVQPALAAHLVLEMLDRIGDEGVFPGDAGVMQGLVENAAGRTDERLAGNVLFVARLLADQHEGGAASDLRPAPLAWRRDRAGSACSQPRPRRAAAAI